MSGSEIYRFRTNERSCLYLPFETACLDYRVIVDLSPESYDDLLSRGWRRMGYHFFRPACTSCSSCISLRVPVHTFAPSKSQKRIRKKNANVAIVVQRPTVTPDHIRLWNAFHLYRKNSRNWRESSITESEYAESFLSGAFSFAREFLYFLDERLIAVGLVDITRNAQSSIYFFHDPELCARGLGVYSVLEEINHAQENGIGHVYLGYWVQECPSMAYKAQYRPHELLFSRPDNSAIPDWRAQQESASRPCMNRGNQR